MLKKKTYRSDRERSLAAETEEMIQRSQSAGSHGNKFYLCCLYLAGNVMERWNVFSSSS